MPEKNRRNKCQVHCRIPPEVFEQLEALRKSRKDAPKRAQLVREAIAAYVEAKGKVAV